MKRVCSWCKKDMGEKPGPADWVTHGICEDCEKKMTAQLDAAEAKKKSVVSNIIPLFLGVLLLLGGCRGIDRLTGGGSEAHQPDPALIGGPKPIDDTAPEFNVVTPEGYDRVVFHGKLPMDGIVKVQANDKSFADVFMKQVYVGQWFRLYDGYSEAFYFSMDKAAGTVTYHGAHLENIEYCVYQYIPKV